MLSIVIKLNRDKRLLTTGFIIHVFMCNFVIEIDVCLFCSFITKWSTIIIFSTTYWGGPHDILMHETGIVPNKDTFTKSISQVRRSELRTRLLWSFISQSLSKWLVYKLYLGNFGNVTWSSMFSARSFFYRRNFVSIRWPMSPTIIPRSGE